MQPKQAWRHPGVVNDLKPSSPGLGTLPTRLQQIRSLPPKSSSSQREEVLTVPELVGETSASEGTRLSEDEREGGCIDHRQQQPLTPHSSRSSEGEEVLAVPELEGGTAASEGTGLLGDEQEGDYINRRLKEGDSVKTVSGGDEALIEELLAESSTEKPKAKIRWLLSEHGDVLEGSVKFPADAEGHFIRERPQDWDLGDLVLCEHLKFPICDAYYVQEEKSGWRIVRR